MKKEGVGTFSKLILSCVGSTFWKYWRQGQNTSERTQKFRAKLGTEEIRFRWKSFSFLFSAVCRPIFHSSFLNESAAVLIRVGTSFLALLKVQFMICAFCCSFCSLSAFGQKLWCLNEQMNCSPLLSWNSLFVRVHVFGVKSCVAGMRCQRFTRNRSTGKWNHKREAMLLAPGQVNTGFILDPWNPYSDVYRRKQDMFLRHPTAQVNKILSNCVSLPLCLQPTNPQQFLSFCSQLLSEESARQISATSDDFPQFAFPWQLMTTIFVLCLSLRLNDCLWCNECFKWFWLWEITGFLWISVWQPGFQHVRWSVQMAQQKKLFAALSQSFRIDIDIQLICDN